MEAPGLSPLDFGTSCGASEHRIIALLQLLFFKRQQHVPVACGGLCFSPSFPWVSRPLLCERFPRLLNLSSRKHGLVFDFCPNPRCWDYYFLRSLIEREIAEFGPSPLSFATFILRLPGPTLGFGCLPRSVPSRFPPFLRSWLSTVEYLFSPYDYLSSALALQDSSFPLKLAWNRAPTLDVIQSFYPHLYLSPSLVLSASLTLSPIPIFFTLPFQLEVMVRLFQIIDLPGPVLGSLIDFFSSWRMAHFDRASTRL